MTFAQVLEWLDENYIGLLFMVVIPFFAIFGGWHKDYGGGMND